MANDSAYKGSNDPARMIPPTPDEEWEFQRLEQKLGLVDVAKMHQQAVEASVIWMDGEDPLGICTMSIRKIFEIGYIKGLQAGKK